MLKKLKFEDEFLMKMKRLFPHRDQFIVSSDDNKNNSLRSAILFRPLMTTNLFHIDFNILN